MAAVRALMVDVDGVVIVTPNWAADLEADLGLAPAVLSAEFFARHWHDVELGRADLHDRLGPMLAEHAPHLTSARLAAYWFEKDSVLDHQLLSDLAALRATGVALHLATVQEHHRARYLWDTLRFRDRFDAMHYAADIGFKKPQPEFFLEVIARTGFAPAETLLIDDKRANVEAARAAGWRAALWDGTRRLADVLATAL